MAREEYRVIVPTFWTDPDIKRKLTVEQKLLVLYYFSSPLSKGNMTGVFYCPHENAAGESGLSIQQIRDFLAGPLAPHVTYDDETEEVFVHGFAKRNVGDELKPGDNRIKGIQRQVSAIHSKRLKDLFLAKYDKAYTLSMGLSEAPTSHSKPLESPSPTPSEAMSLHDIPSHPMSPHSDVSTKHPTFGRAGDAPAVEQPVQDPTPQTEQPTEEEVPELDINKLTPNQVRLSTAYLGEVRRVWWAPDGKPPKGWTEGREVHIYWQRRRKKESHEDLLQMVTGARLLVDKGGAVTWAKKGDKLTGRVLNNTHAGALDFGTMALDAAAAEGERDPPGARRIA